MAITVTGAAVRLTGSGLGCTDWPNCTVNSELDAPGFHSAVEFGNRVISGLAIIPVIAAFLAARRAERRDLSPWFVAMVAGFIGQVLLGMLVTRTELDPRIVLGHFLLSIVLILIGVVLDYRARVQSVTDLRWAEQPQVPEHELEQRVMRRRHARILLASASALIVVGTLVTGSGPHTGSGTTGEPVPRLGFDIREISRAHSLFGWLLVALIVYGLVRTRRSPDTTRWSAIDQTWFMRIGAMAVIQGGIGYLQYATGVPVGLVALHIAGSVVLWTMICWYTLMTTYPLVAGRHEPRETAPVS